MEPGHTTEISGFLQTIDLIIDYAISDKEKLKMIEAEIKKEYDKINIPELITHEPKSEQKESAGSDAIIEKLKSECRRVKIQRNKYEQDVFSAWKKINNLKAIIQEKERIESQPQEVNEDEINKAFNRGVEAGKLLRRDSKNLMS